VARHFTLITHRIENVLAQGKNAANGKDIRIGGGLVTVKQYLMPG